jgi:tetratricopeptide (TPR) repeat protein
VFNIPVQAFSDVVDLEEYDEYKPAQGAPSALIAEGQTALRAGDLGRAFAFCERAVEILDEEPPSRERDEAIARARIHLAAALSRLGKLSLAERELRTALRQVDRLTGELKAQALLYLANLHADQGDLFLAELEADRAQQYAGDEGLDLLRARILHTLARVLAGRGQDAQAIERYREAAEQYDACGDTFEAIRVRINIGVCYVGMGKVREAIRLLRTALADARSRGFRRLEAHSWSSLGEAYYRQRDPRHARVCFAESNAIAGAESDLQNDLLFVNAFYEWKISSSEGSPTREKIAFGRLKALRSSLEKRFPEVEAFDAYVERGRSDA